MKFIFPNIAGGTLTENVQMFLEEHHVADAQDICNFCFTHSAQKGMNQSCQAFLLRAVKRRVIKRQRTIKCRGRSENEKRYLYTLKDSSFGTEAGHKSLLTKFLVSIRLMKRLNPPYIEIAGYDLSTKSVRVENMILPITTIELRSGTFMIPDAIVGINVENKHRILCLVEIDCGTESIPPRSQDELEDSNSLIGKIERLNLFCNDKDAQNHFAGPKALKGILGMFVFSSESRMHRFRQEIVRHFKKDLPHVYMTTYTKIDCPSNFWGANIWFKAEQNAKPIALIQNKKLAYAPLS